MKMNRLVATLLALVVSSACLWGQSVKSEDVFIQSGDDVLKGTLSHVKQARKSPKTLAIILPGSGPTNRNGNGAGPSLQTNMYDHLAAVLQSQGISTLQVDKRGVGESSLKGGEGSLSYSGNVQDYEAWWALGKQSGYESLVLVGHSEGGQIALTWAAKRRPEGLKGLVLLAPPGENAADILWEQLSRQLAPDSEYGQFAKTSLDSLKEGYLLGRPSPPALLSLFRPSIQPYLVDWFQDEPMDNLNRLSADLPIHIFYGGKDIQVQPSEAMLSWGAQNSPNAQLYTCPSMTHTLKSDVPGQRLATYSDPDLPLDVELVDTLRTILSNLRRHL
ncbi:alpha/beta hydrolase [Schleiferiaceae bacterium]|nr:alpha/beta hydrolase [Schleiferiaceae bacterium]